MKTLILLLLTTITILFSGCRAYRGYKDFEEDNLIDVDNEKVVSVSYQIYTNGNQLELSESKKIEFRETRERIKTRDWAYKINTYEYLLVKDPNLLSVLGAIFALPIDVTVYPFRLIYSFFADSGWVSYDGNSYYTSKGRQIWLTINPLFSIFQINGSIDNIHSEVADKETYTKQKSKREQNIIQDYILVKSKNKNFTVLSDIEISKISKKLFTYPLPIQEETVKLIYKNYEKDFTISSKTEILDIDLTNYNLATNASSEDCFNQNDELINKVKKLKELKYISPEHSKNLKKEIRNKSIDYGKKYKQELLKQISMMTPEICFEQTNYLEQEIKKFDNILGDTKELKQAVTEKISECKIQLLDKINKMSPETCWEKKNDLEEEFEKIKNILGNVKELNNSLEKKTDEYKIQLEKQLLDKINKMSPETCWEKKNDLEKDIKNIENILGSKKAIKIQKLIQAKREIVITKDKQLCFEIKTQDSITDDLKKQFFNRIKKSLSISELEKDNLKEIIKKKYEITKLKYFENKFPYKHISSPQKLYKEIYSGSALEWLTLYSKFNRLDINIKTINNKNDIIVDTEKLLIYEMNNTVVGITFTLPSIPKQELKTKINTLLVKLTHDYKDIKSPPLIDKKNIILKNKHIEIRIQSYQPAQLRLHDSTNGLTNDSDYITISITILDIPLYNYFFGKKVADTANEFNL